MNEQLDFWANRDKTIQERFEKYHADNPHVYKLLMRYIRMVQDAGYEHYSVDAIFNRIRWHVQIETKDANGFKMNDHYTSRYARLVEEEHPELIGFFETRVLRSA